MRPGTNQHHVGGAPTRPVNPRRDSIDQRRATGRVLGRHPETDEVLRAHNLASLPASLALTLAISDCRDKSSTAPRRAHHAEGNAARHRQAHRLREFELTARRTGHVLARREDARVEPPQVHAHQGVPTEGAKSCRRASRGCRQAGHRRRIRARRTAPTRSAGKPLSSTRAACSKAATPGAVERDEIGERLGRIQVVGVEDQQRIVRRERARRQHGVGGAQRLRLNGVVHAKPRDTRVLVVSADVFVGGRHDQADVGAPGVGQAAQHVVEKRTAVAHCRSASSPFARARRRGAGRR